MSQQCTKRFGSQPVTNDNAGGTSACKTLVAVLIFLTACKCNDLSCHVGTELLLAGASLNHYICSDLTFSETDKLQRNDIGSLVQ